MSQDKIPTPSDQPALSAAPLPPATVPPSQESTSRKAFVATIVSIILSPISVALGFYLNHSFQKPQLRIEDLEQSYVMESHTLPQLLLSAIQGLPMLSMQLRDVITRMELAKGDVSCVDWLDGKEWKDSCFETVLTAARGIQGDLAASASRSPPKVLEAVLPTPNDVANFRRALDPLIAWLTKAGSEDQKARTGDMCIQANILNSGDSDGVVAPTATLRFDKGEFSMYADKYTVIKGHGYEQMEFCGNSVIEGQKPIFQAWRGAVSSGQETPFQLIVTTGDKVKLSASAHLWKP